MRINSRLVMVVLVGCWCPCWFSSIIGIAFSSFMPIAVLHGGKFYLTERPEGSTDKRHELVTPLLFVSLPNPSAAPAPYARRSALGGRGARLSERTGRRPPIVPRLKHETGNPNRLTPRPKDTAPISSPPKPAKRSCLPFQWPHPPMVACDRSVFPYATQSLMRHHFKSLAPVSLVFILFRPCQPSSNHDHSSKTSTHRRRSKWG